MRQLRPPPDDFGIELTIKNVDAINARMHADTEAYRRADKEDAHFLEELVTRPAPPDRSWPIGLGRGHSS